MAGEKQERKAAALAKIEEEKNAITMLVLANEYYERQILGRWKHPDIVRRRIDKDIGPMPGHMKVEDIKPRHIDDMLQAIVKRGAPSIANDTLRWVRRMFDYGIKRHIIGINQASAFDLNYAGGKEEARDRTLSRDELVKLFAAMKLAKGFSVENDLSIRLLLCVRKMELCAARWEEFDLDNAVWHLPPERSKTGKAIDIPLPALARLAETATYPCLTQSLGTPGQEDAAPHGSPYPRGHDRYGTGQGQATHGGRTRLHRA